MAPTPTDIHKFLAELFSDEELTTLCSDFFPTVYDQFTNGMTKGQKVQLLLDYCRRREDFPRLQGELERERPAQYRQRFGTGYAFPAAEPHPPVRDPRQVFISHAHEDAEFAHRLAADLRARGWRIWIVPDSIRPGEKWVAAINHGLEESGVFLVVLTPAAVASKWVTDETNVAKEMQQEGELRLIPLGVADCRVPPLWRVHQRISFTGAYPGAYSAGLAALLAELENASGQPEAQRPAAPIVEAQGKQGATAPDVAGTATLLSASQPGGPKAASEAPRRMGTPAASPDLLTITLPIHLELVQVPAGEFLMGSDPRVDKQAAGDEQPQHKLLLPEFFIGKVPVTNAQYASFVKAANRKAPTHWEKDVLPAGKAEHPVVNVSWQDAVDFCRWLSEATRRSFRLPSEAEWEKAARGGDGRIYPWGNQAPDEKRCNFGGKIGGTTPVGKYPSGVSPCGALDMAGNVWEWTSSAYKLYPYEPTDGREDPGGPAARVLRGGAFLNPAVNVRCAVRARHYPYDRDRDFGFRVVASPVV